MGTYLKLSEKNIALNNFTLDVHTNRCSFSFLIYALQILLLTTIPYSEIFLRPKMFVDFAVFFTNRENFIHQHFSMLATVVSDNCCN